MSELKEIIRRLSSPLEPQPTGVQPKLPKLTGIKAVVFDVYGTLLISGSGDISLTSGVSHGDAALDALSAVLGEPATSVVGVTGDEVVKKLLEAIHSSHAASEFEYPEVDIREVWHEVLDSIGIALSEQQIEQLSIEYECRVNPVWPMPGMANTLSAIQRADKWLGIVSNAQFFTPITMEALMGKWLGLLGFDTSMCIWSYGHRQAKPGQFLYDCAAGVNRVGGCKPHQVLYVGNDMRNDIWPASKVGFRTALFAGDARSLRLREGDPDVAKVVPDAVITELGQILPILALAEE